MADRVAEARVQTATPERYVKQLASHLGRRSEVVHDDDAVTIVLTAGRCALRTGDGVLLLEARAPSPEELEIVMRVIGSHLERFGTRNELRVAWQAVPAGDAAPAPSSPSNR